MKKRILAIALCLTMVLTTGSFAFAAEELSQPATYPTTEVVAEDTEIEEEAADEDTETVTEEVEGEDTETISEEDIIEETETEAAELSLYDQLMAAETVAAMYAAMTSADKADLDALTKDEINAIFDRVSELDPQETEDETGPLVDLLINLPGFVSGAEEDGEESEAFATKITDDYEFTKDYATSNNITIKNENAKPSEANWKINGGVTLTINHTVTIPEGESLDVYVNTSGGDVPNITFGSNGKFVVNGTLKINYDSSQNKKTVKLTKSKIQINSTGIVRMTDINTVNGDSTWTFAKGSRLYLHGDIPVGGSLSITGTGTVIRDSFNGTMFDVKDDATLNVAGTDNRIIIDGGVNNWDIACERQQVGDYRFSDRNAHSSYEYYGRMITSRAADVDINNVTVQNVQYDANGAVIYCDTTDSTASIDLEDVIVRDISCRTAIYIAGANGQKLRTVTVEDCEFTGIYMESDAEYGGVIRTNGTTNCSLTVNNSQFIDNYSCGGGAAVFWNAHGSTDAKAVLNGCKFINNRCDGRGGGAINNEATIEMSGCTFENNSTRTDFDDVYYLKEKNDGTATDYMQAYSRHTCSKHNSDGRFELVGVTSIGLDEHTEEAVKGRIANGGAIIVMPYYNQLSAGGEQEVGLVIDKKCTFNNNTGYRGGAVSVMIYPSQDTVTSYNISLTTADCTLSGNKATYGGAISFTNAAEYDSLVTLGTDADRSIISSNTATYGGALYVSNTDVDVVNAEIKGNSSTTNGGAIYLDSGDLTMSGGNILNNTATQNGGAVYVSGGNYLMTSGTIANCEAGNNGGAVYVNSQDGNSSVVFGVESCSGTGDKHSVDPKTLKHPAISNNKAQNGGAVAVTKGDPVMHCGEFTGNTAVQNGGAIYVADGSFTMKNGNITQNTANLGGAAYVAGSVLVEHGKLSGNEAVNGGAVYVNGGNFTMESGTLSNNNAKEITSGQAEAGNEGYGGGVYANNGNITIGIKDCTQAVPCAGHDGSSYTHHPIVTANDAEFGGGFAINNGIVTFYCCNVDENTSDNKGTGMNVFMSGASGVINHHYDGAIIGDDNDHGMVSIGGNLNVEHTGGTLNIAVKYHSNDPEYRENKVEVIWSGVAPNGYFLNLPYCPSDWVPQPKEDGLIFAGWTEHEPVKETDSDAIRTKDDYWSVGDPVLIEDKTDGEKEEIHFYAVWAPEVNNISYAYMVDGTNIKPAAIGTDFELDNPLSTYMFEMTSNDDLFAGIPVKAGYTFKGWMMYADHDTMSNWNADPYNDKQGVPYDRKNNLYDETPTLKSQFVKTVDGKEVTFSYLDENILKTLQNFGDITLVAVFDPAYTDLVINKTISNGVIYDTDQTYLFNVKGTPYDGSEAVDLTVAMYGTNSKTIQDLPVGMYTVTEIADWSWRYDFVDARASKGQTEKVVSNGVEINIADPETIYQTTFTNLGNYDYWLSGDTYKMNYYAAGVGSWIPLPATAPIQ